jgi:hypothetical protein
MSKTSQRHVPKESQSNAAESVSESQLLDAFMRKPAGDAHVAAVQSVLTNQQIKALQSQPPIQMVDNLTSDKLIRLILEKHLPHIDRLEKMEKQFEIILEDWNSSMRVLFSVAVILQKNEARLNFVTPKSKRALQFQSPNSQTKRIG